MASDAPPELMLAFYQRLYPFQSLFTWLNHSHSPSRRFTNREFAFTLQNDVYLRYNSFQTHEDLKKAICQYNPTRFEIGPVYSLRPRDKKTARPGTMIPLERELVFDIDMTDYDPIRTCCSGADICRRCWAYIAAAVRVLDSSIRSHYGYNQLLWVYSGRRGIHLWISDKEAMELTDEQRKAIVGWMTVIHTGGKERARKLDVRTQTRELQPPLKTALDEQLQFYFTDIVLKDQDCFASDEGFKSMISIISNPDIAQKLEKYRAGGVTDSYKLWTYLMGLIDDPPLPYIGEDIIFHYTYPRLDAEVSKHRNHLLKAPFCVHPKTGRVCVPVDPAHVDKFDPERVPTVGKLLAELSRAQPGLTEEPGLDWQKTSLKPYVEMLDQHVARILDSVRAEKLKGEKDLAW